MKKDKAEDTMHILLAVVLYVLFPAVSNPRAFPTQGAVSTMPESCCEAKVFAPGLISSGAHLGNAINSPTSDAEARLSPDGRTLYFSSERIASVKQPLSPTERQQAVQDMQWNNGLYNIWQVSLAPWLDARPR